MQKCSKIPVWWREFNSSKTEWKYILSSNQVKGLVSKLVSKLVFKQEKNCEERYLGDLKLQSSFNINTKCDK